MIPYIIPTVRVEVRAENRGTNNNNISMICRYDIEEGWYEVNVTNGGLYNILYGKWDNSRTSATYTRLADGGSTLIKAGKDVNTYAFVCRGRTLILFINGEEDEAAGRQRQGTPQRANRHWRILLQRPHRSRGI